MRQRFSVMAQRGQLVRYLMHCRGWEADAAWQRIDHMRASTRREWYRLLRECIALGLIIWQDGRFVEVKKRIRSRRLTR